MQRKGLRKHLREGAQLSLDLNQSDRWLEECVTSWNIVADDNDKPRLTASQAEDMLDRIEWSEDEDFEEEESTTHD